MRLRRLGVVAALTLLTLPLSPPAAASTGPAFHLEPVISGLYRPVYVAAPGSPNRLYVVQQNGVIKVLRRASPTDPWVNAGNFLDLRAKVSKPLASLGLLGMAFHPDYAKNGYFYVYYARKDADAELNKDLVVVEYRRRTSLRARPASARLVVAVSNAQSYHPGGWIGFGPDGFMYMTTGDGALDQPDSPAQVISSQKGKVLRFDARKSMGEAGFAPADNPFVGVDGDDLVWAYGLRNPWRASFDSVTGDFWISDPGEYDWEEVDRFSPAGSARGANLGWDVCEGTHVYPEPLTGPESCGDAATVVPTIEFGHDGGPCAVVGGYVYRGTAQATLSGRYFYGDYCTGDIWSVPADHAADSPIDDPLVSALNIASFGVDALGELYVADLKGRLWHVVEGAPD